MNREARKIIVIASLFILSPFILGGLGYMTIAGIGAFQQFEDLVYSQQFEDFLHDTALTTVGEKHFTTAELKQIGTVMIINTKMSKPTLEWVFSIDMQDFTMEQYQLTPEQVQGIKHEQAFKFTADNTWLVAKPPSGGITWSFSRQITDYRMVALDLKSVLIFSDTLEPIQAGTTYESWKFDVVLVKENGFVPMLWFSMNFAIITLFFVMGRSLYVKWFRRQIRKEAMGS